MSDTMIERIVNAAWTELDSQDGWSGSIDFDPVARAILAAMHKPTNYMVERACTQAPNQTFPDLSDAWSAMIDAALEDGR